MTKTNCNNAQTLSEEKFVEYLNSNLDNKVIEFVDELSKKLDLLVFSGVIRDFYLEHSGQVRDLDLVVKKNFHQLEHIIREFNDAKYDINSFGGYKVKISNINIDIWNAEDTWAFKERKIKQHYIFVEEDLPYSCFFNFSSIVFDLKRKRFINSKNFNSFLKTKTLDIVLEENPYPELCIVNTFYYQDKFDLKISKSLKNYLRENFHTIPQHKFENIQIKHFNRILYAHETLKNRIDNLSANRRSYKKKNALI